MSVENPVHLSDRRLIRVYGADAQSFLQNIMSNDIAKTESNGLVYSLLLTPQGQFLYDFFVLTDSFHAEGGYLLDMHQDQIEAFLKRMVMFKLRAKVMLEPVSANRLRVYSHPDKGLPDPRLPAMGLRLYTDEAIPSAATLTTYHDHRIAQGVPDGSLTMKTQKDFPAGMNLDHLHALGWEKGCFIGQEVVARMYHRGLAKKRLAIITGSGLGGGNILSPAGRPVGEIRETDSRNSRALALVRLDVLAEKPPAVTVETGGIDDISLPLYISI